MTHTPPEPTTVHPSAPPPQNALTRFLGGPPLWVLLKLVMLSVLIGLVLGLFGFDLASLIYALQDLFYGFFDNIWEAVDTIWRWFLVGAVIVFPIWLIARLLKAGRP